MSALKYELLINSTPYYENLINELQIIFNQKKKLIDNIDVKYIERLSIEEKGVLKHLFQKENELLFEIIKYKKWFDTSDDEKMIAEKLGLSLKDEDDSEFYGKFAFNLI